MSLEITQPPSVADSYMQTARTYESVADRYRLMTFLVVAATGYWAYQYDKRRKAGL